MSLIEENKHLFFPPYPDNTGDNFRDIFREFLKVDDMHGNMFMNKIYDYEDYKEYR